MRIAGDKYQFEEWVKAGRENSIKEYDVLQRRYVPIDLAPDELARRTAWNATNRRVLDLRPVTNREKAAAEVLKYITKSADFADVPETVEQFMDATKGARLVQTFGTWYGFKVDTIFDPEHLDDWGQRKCACGLNCWERMGVFGRRDVEMDAEGRWHLKRSIEQTCRGTVPRPTIRALDGPEKENEGESLWQVR